MATNSKIDDNYWKTLLKRPKLSTGEDIVKWMEDEMFWDDKFELIEFYDNKANVRIWGGTYHPRYADDEYFVMDKIENILRINSKRKFIMYHKWEWNQVSKTHDSIICIRNVGRMPIQYP